jgi:MarR family transcriptional regulator, organic hydroperoxide resistance regulator
MASAKRQRGGTRAEEAASTQALSDALAEFFRATRRARGREAGRPVGDGISLAQFHMLEPLGGGPLTNRQLADAADVSSPTATRMIDVLSARGLVERVEDPTDRRAVLISLTRAGRATLQDKLDRYQALREQVAETLDPDERQIAAELLHRLTEVIEEL